MAHTLSEPEVRACVRSAAAALGWRGVAEDAGRLVFRVGLNAYSWGESVVVTLRPGRVTIASQCRWFAQLADSGKNARNCAGLARALAAARPLPPG